MVLILDNDMYPILSDVTGDYINSSFRINYTILENVDSKKKVKVTFEIKDEIIEQMLESEQLILLLNLNCPQIKTCKLFPIHNKNREAIIDIHHKEYGSRVEISGFIVVNKSIDLYKNKNINPYFYGKDYHMKNLKKGAPLGATSIRVFNIA